MLLDNSSFVCKYVSIDTVCGTNDLWRGSLKWIMGDFMENDHIWDGNDVLLAVEQLAHLIHKSPASIRSDASRNLNALPPICRLPGSKRLLWRRQDVMAWIAQFVQASPSKPQSAVLMQEVPRRRGRPRKTEQRVQP